MPPDISNVARTHCENYAKEYASLTKLNPDEPTVPMRQSIALSTADSVAILQHEEEQRAKKQPGSQEDPPKPLPILAQPELLQKISAGDPDFRRVFVTGGGGTGKSETTRLIAHHLATAFLNGTSKLLPLRVELKGATEKLTGGWKELLELLAPDEHGWLVSGNHRKNICFIIDGLDECRFTRDQFAAAMKRVIAEFEDCSFILAGRPGSLPDGLQGFATHVIQPLSYGQIGAFASAYFAAPPGRSKQMAKELASSFVSALRSAQHTLDPLIFTPFMVHFALRLHSKGLPIPANPALLIEQGLLKLWDDRRDRKSIATPTNDGKATLTLPESDVILDALSTIAAHTLLRERRNTEAVPKLDFSPDDAKQWLKDHSELCKSVNLTDLFHRLVPHCGVLFRAGDDYVFNNKVLAEFLSARWIARYGYPNWPYRERSKAYVDPGRVKDERERSLFDLFGDFAWSDVHEPLMQAVCWQLGRMDTLRSSGNISLLIASSRWFLDVNQLVNLFRTGDVANPDLLRYRACSCLAAVPSSSSLVDAMLPLVSSVADVGDINWIKDTETKSRLARLPRDFIDHLRVQLVNTLNNSINSEDMASGQLSDVIECLCQIWPEEVERHKDLLAFCKTLLLTHGKRRDENVQRFLEKVLRAQPIGGAVKRMVLRRLSSGLRKTLADEAEICGLFWMLAKGCPDEPYVLDLLLEATSGSRVFADPETQHSLSLLRELPSLLAVGWPSKSETRRVLLECVKSETHSLSMDQKVQVLLRAWPRDSVVRDALLGRLKIGDQQRRHEPLVRLYLAKALGRGWSGDAVVLPVLRKLLLQAVRPRVDRSWFVVNGLALAVAQCADDNQETWELLRSLAERELRMRNVDLRVYLGLIGALAWGFRNDIEQRSRLMRLPRTMLRESGLDTFLFNWVAEILAFGWPGDIEVVAMVESLNLDVGWKFRRWRPWVVLVAPASEIRCLLESWGAIQSGQALPPEFARPVKEFINPDTDQDPQYCLVYPREAIRRGLPASILHDIIDASRPVTPIDPVLLIGPVAGALKIQIRENIDTDKASTLIAAVVGTFDRRPSVPPDGKLDEIAAVIAEAIKKELLRLKEFKLAVMEPTLRIRFSFQAPGTVEVMSDDGTDTWSKLETALSGDMFNDLKSLVQTCDKEGSATRDQIVAEEKRRRGAISNLFKALIKKNKLGKLIFGMIGRPKDKVGPHNTYGLLPHAWFPPRK